MKNSTSRLIKIVRRARMDGWNVTGISVVAVMLVCSGGDDNDWVVVGRTNITNITNISDITYIPTLPTLPPTLPTLHQHYQHYQQYQHYQYCQY